MRIDEPKREGQNGGPKERLLRAARVAAAALTLGAPAPASPAQASLHPDATVQETGNEKEQDHEEAVERVRRFLDGKGVLADEERREFLPLLLSMAQNAYDAQQKRLAANSANRHLAGEHLIAQQSMVSFISGCKERAKNTVAVERILAPIVHGVRNSEGTIDVDATAKLRLEHEGAVQKFKQALRIAATTVPPSRRMEAIQTIQDFLALPKDVRDRAFFSLYRVNPRGRDDQNENPDYTLFAQAV